MEHKKIISTATRSSGQQVAEACGGFPFGAILKKGGFVMTNKGNCISYLESIHRIISDLTDAHLYFCEEELEESRKQFIADMMCGQKQHYINFLKQQIEEIKPEGLHGLYDFSLIREYKNALKMIEDFSV